MNHYFFKFLIAIVLLISIDESHSQTVNLQNSGKVQIKNGKIKTKGDIVVGDDNFITKTYSLSKIISITHESSGDIEVYYSDECKVEIDADKNILDLIKVSSPGGRINIQSSKSYVSNNSVNIRIYTNNLSNITLEGSGNINVYDFYINSFNIILEGSGNITVSGQTRSLKIKSEGSGNINCSNMKSENAEIRLEGAGNIDVYATKFLKIYHDGAGDINYWGSPKTNIIHEGVGDIIEN